ncbi:MAG TPA: ATP-binding protein [Sphingomonadales bacterium]
MMTLPRLDFNWARLISTLSVPAAVILILWIAGAISALAALVFLATVALTLAWVFARHGTELDIETRRARIAAARRPRNDRRPVLAGLVEGMGDPLILLDLDQRVVHANRAARRLFGRQIVGQDITFYLRHPAAIKAIEQAIERGQADEQEITIFDPVERAFLIRVTALDMDGAGGDGGEDDGPARYLVVSIVDVTKMKRAEKMRVDFVANASHELRTPLASVLGFVETLMGKAGEDPATRSRFLGIVHDEATRMQRLINDLLSLSRIEMDQHVAPEGEVDLVPLLEGIARTMGLRTEGDLVRIEAPEHLPPVRGDRDQLLQVFQNLIDNACKYGRPGAPVELRLSLVDHLPNRALPGVAVAVFNHGEGIPPEHLPRLTERFYRVDTARSRKLGGTGLGLAIVKHIIARHRGALQIESEQGVGTTVTVSLPRADVAEDAAEDAANLQQSGL